jgi:hypothetical protein
MSEWLPVLRELGGIGLAALMAWRVVQALDRNTRVLYRIEGVLLGKAVSPETPPEMRSHERS